MLAAVPLHLSRQQQLMYTTYLSYRFSSLFLESIQCINSVLHYLTSHLLLLEFLLTSIQLFLVCYYLMTLRELIFFLQLFYFFIAASCNQFLSFIQFQLQTVDADC